MVENLFYLSLIVVFLIDISGVVDSIKSGISYVLTRGKISTSNYRLKPFDCSLCMTFWTGLIYLLIVGELTLFNFLIACFFSAFSGVMRAAILCLEDAALKLIQNIYKNIIDK